ncbi:MULTISPECIES: PEGA domain-containing protein [unclassified Corallococcus]|uniref:PEGA domain-containing protein n=1 Tax=unclassified Corallococcus TaxID=2685029 RepID=UPI001A8E37E4|nr:MULTISPECIES: PEGA domain-containing protein [unclassified Corallococcus]MBN9685983.1 PEGA domain-containing protein [Corallococcus sp. NCSPR001]WAS82578.1 PEGA domain-containing protein [Corallococcus sp. NCRR]
MPPHPRRLLITLLLAGTCACAARAPVSRDVEALAALRLESIRPLMPSAPRGVRAERPVTTGLRLDVMPDRARVFVDGRAMGLARHLGTLLPLSPGVHQVSVRLEGHDTWRAEVMVGDRPEPIQVTLTASP